MELKCITQYATSGFSLKAGETTEGRDISESKKAQMLNDFPGSFEVVKVVAEPAPAAPAKELVVETKVPLADTKESGETPSKKAARSRKN